VLKVEPTVSAVVAVTATKLSLVPLQKHSLGDCTIDMPRRTAVSVGISFCPRDAIIWFAWNRHICRRMHPLLPLHCCTQQAGFAG